MWAHLLVDEGLDVEGLEHVSPKLRVEVHLPDALVQQLPNLHTQILNVSQLAVISAAPLSPLNSLKVPLADRHPEQLSTIHQHKHIEVKQL